ncbi:MAG: methyltransferase domain-containing protein [Candidatus Caldarchaeum sp.]
MKEPYKPSEDTFLLEDVIRSIDVRGLAAEVGCSTGYILLVLAELGLEVVGTDIDAEAVSAARERLRNHYGLIHLVNASSLPFRPGSLDLVVANPPYLPCDSEFYDPSIHGGPSGVETAIQVLTGSVKTIKDEGRVVMVASSLSDLRRLLDHASRIGFSLAKKVELRLFFESLYCFIFTRRS